MSAEVNVGGSHRPANNSGGSSPSRAVAMRPQILQIQRSPGSLIIRAVIHWCAMRHLTLLPIILLAGCACQPEQVAVPTPVPVPGPTVYLPIPAELLACDDTGPPPAVGQPLGELFAWAQRTRAASVECQARLAEIHRLAPP